MAGRFDAMAAGIHSHADGCEVVVREIATGALARTGHARHRLRHRADPEEWWQAMLAAIVDAGGFKDVAAFAITATPTVVLVDVDGAVVRPALSGGDRGRRQAASDVVAEIGADRLRRRTGAVPGAPSALAALRWLRDRAPADADRTEAAVLAHDWLTWRLRGFGPGGDTSHGTRLEELATDGSEAGATGYWDIDRGRWDHGLFNIALGHAAIKPRVMRPDGWGGETAKRPEQGIRTGRVMGVGARPDAAALLGWGAAPGDAVARLHGRTLTLCAVTEAPVHAEGVAASVDAAGHFLATADAAARSTADHALGAARDALRAAGVAVTRLLLPEPTAALAAAAAASGVATATAPTGTHIADGAAAQAAWATSRRLPRWPGVAAGV